jgi:outer membrane biosynthesis protein TonB
MSEAVEAQPVATPEPQEAVATVVESKPKGRPRKAPVPKAPVAPKATKVAKPKPKAPKKPMVQKAKIEEFLLESSSEEESEVEQKPVARRVRSQPIHNVVAKEEERDTQSGNTGTMFVLGGIALAALSVFALRR